MFSNTVTSLIALAFLPGLSLAAEAHGASAQGTVMGPAAFLWPADRPWSGLMDNIGPCGSSISQGNRTDFPLGTAGAVSFTIADEAYDIALRIAYGNDPTSQSDFSAIHGTIKEFEPGHQCYGVPAPPSTVTAGSNATIQMEYWANDSNKNESFFACADITFVETAAFTLQIPCFNVTSTEFEEATPSSTSTGVTVQTNTPAADSSAAESTTTPVAKSASGGGLSAGAKAGISIAAIVAALMVGAAAFFVVRRRRSSKKDTESGVVPEMAKGGDAASFRSAETAVAN